MTKSESKYFNTAQLMDEALIELLSKKDYEFINVKEICEKAGVNRSTFYLHYETMNDLLNETCEYINKEFMKNFDVSPKDFIGNIPSEDPSDLILINREYLIPYLTFFKNNKKIYKAALNNASTLKAEDQLSSLYKYVLKPIFDRFSIPEGDQKYWLAYHIHGITAIVNEWVKDDCEDDITHIADVIIVCVRPHKPK